MFLEHSISRKRSWQHYRTRHLKWTTSWKINVCIQKWAVKVTGKMKVWPAKSTIGLVIAHWLVVIFSPWVELFSCYLQSAIIGSQVEQKVVNSLEKNKTLLSFGMSFDTQGPRIRAAELMVRNNDASKLYYYALYSLSIFSMVKILQLVLQITQLSARR